MFPYPGRSRKGGVGCFIFSASVTSWVFHRSRSSTGHPSPPACSAWRKRPVLQGTQASGLDAGLEALFQCFDL